VWCAQHSLGQGIGRAIALRLADDGFDVAVNDISVDHLESLVEDIRMKGRLSSMHKADISVEDQVRTLVENVVRKHGGLDVVSNRPLGVSGGFTYTDASSRWWQTRVSPSGNQLLTVNVCDIVTRMLT
jgi:NADP-dependent 3-hydroxy acid dehydrogenase YdfG